ncbi:hypothetical protein CQW23_04619 [Capsicum baccatum]|uniref:F-box domain-containing protein n=1 Tax=Capsicum baccatum TaxID=33114 RepID=A0A2G2XF60_CAPBA|nr:hypothetical protein CQW23_04619 [Capsicum baccatum]
MPKYKKVSEKLCGEAGRLLISWKSNKQQTVSRSSAEAEYRSMTAAVAEATWITSFLHELNMQAPLSFIMSHSDSSDSSQSKSENVETAYVDQCYGDKRRKMDNKPDRLSALPDHLLLHILSSFEMKDVIRTGVLSKRWRLLWTSAHNLSFTHSPESNRDVTEFIKSVDDTLILSKPSKLNKFSVEFFYIDDQFVDHVNRWMTFVTIKSVEVLDLNLMGGFDEGYSLPQLMYSNVCLRKLKLSNCNLVPKEGINWPALRVLSMWYAKLSLEVVDAICSGCTEDEDSDDGDDEYKELTIWARNVTSLEINGCFHKKILVLQNVQALVDAKLYYLEFRTNQKMLSDLLASLGHVEKLSIGQQCLEKEQPSVVWGEVLASQNSHVQKMHVAKMKMLRWMRGGVIELNEVIQDKVEMTLVVDKIRETRLKWYAHMMRRGIDGLVIKENDFGFNEDPNDLTEENYWISRPCWGRRLKTLRIYGTWIYESCYFEQIMPFLEAVLKNGIVLEKIILTPFKYGISIYPMQHARVTQKLLSFPRSSEDAVIVFSASY